MSGRNVVFQNVKVGPKFLFQRPSKREGYKISTQEHIPPVLQNNRKGDVSLVGLRPNFEMAPIRPRLPTDFTKQDMLDDNILGAKVRLSDDTLRKMFEVQIADERDVKWTTEKARLEALGDASLPFNREQRTIKKMVNMGEASVKAASKSDVDKQYAIIKRSIDQGMLDNKSGMATIGAYLAQLLIVNSAKKTLTPLQVKSLITTATQLTIPKDFRAAGFGHRFWSSEQIKPYKSHLILFLIANLGTKTGLNPSAPIPQIVYDSKTDAFVQGSSVDITHIISAMNSKGEKKKMVKGVQYAAGRKLKYLDLLTYSVVPVLFALQQVSNGADGGYLNGVKVPTPLDGKSVIPLEICLPSVGATTNRGKNIKTLIKGKAGPLFIVKGGTITSGAPSPKGFTSVSVPIKTIP